MKLPWRLQVSNRGRDGEGFLVQRSFSSYLPWARLTRWNWTGLGATGAPVRGLLSDSSSAALTSCLQKGHILVQSKRHSLSFPHHFCPSLTFLCTPCLHVQMHVANTGTCGKRPLTFTHVNVWRRVYCWVNFQSLELINTFYLKTKNSKIVIPLNHCLIYGPQSVYWTVSPKVFTWMVHVSLHVLLMITYDHNHTYY